MHSGFQEKKVEYLKGDSGTRLALPPCVQESADCCRKCGFGGGPTQHSSRTVAARREAGPLVPTAIACEAAVPHVPLTNQPLGSTTPTVFFLLNQTKPNHQTKPNQTKSPSFRSGPRQVRLTTFVANSPYWLLHAHLSGPNLLL